MKLLIPAIVGHMFANNQYTRITVEECVEHGWSCGHRAVAITSDLAQGHDPLMFILHFQENFA